MELQKILNNLEEAKRLIAESTLLVSEAKVSEQVGDKWTLTDEFEQSVFEINSVGEAIKAIFNPGSDTNPGKFDDLLEEAKNKTKEFFSKQYKQKKYEGARIIAGYTVVNRKDIDGNPDARFVVIEKKPNSKAIDEYLKATKSKDHPDGILPNGIVFKSYEYVTFKNIANEED